MRRCFQIRLRTVLVLMALCAVAFGWIGANRREWQAEQRALVAIGPAAIEDTSRPAIQFLFL